MIDENLQTLANEITAYGELMREKMIRFNKLVEMQSKLPESHQTTVFWGGDDALNEAIEAFENALE